jgi:fucose 4-O-acetylase-like acetyltransferase
MQTPVTATRDQTLDAVKGMGIILMVLGHAGVPFHDFIYLFHMALFFMLSGYLWSDNKVQTLPGLGKYLLSRLKGLLLPFALCNIAFTLLQTPLNLLHLNPEDTANLSLAKTAVNVAKNMLFAGDTPLGGATWFLRTLFFVYAGHALIRYIVCKLKWGKYLFALVVLITVVATVYIDRTDLSLPMGIHTCFSAYCAFLLGWLLRRLSLLPIRKAYNLPVAIVSFALLCLLTPFGPIGIGAGSIVHLPIFVVASVAGFFATYCFAKCLKGKASAALAYCGRHTLWIVTLHFLAFKPVALGYLLLTGKSLAGLSQFPVYAHPWLWPVYTVVGVVLPLAVYQLWKALIHKQKRTV